MSPFRGAYRLVLTLATIGALMSGATWTVVPIMFGVYWITVHFVP